MVSFLRLLKCGLLVWSGFWALKPVRSFLRGSSLEVFLTGEDKAEFSSLSGLANLNDFGELGLSTPRDPSLSGLALRDFKLCCISAALLITFFLSFYVSKSSKVLARTGVLAHFDETGFTLDILFLTLSDFCDLTSKITGSSFSFVLMSMLKGWLVTTPPPEMSEITCCAWEPRGSKR